MKSKYGFINKTAFTLAEVLITLLIIGVVSSLVIPALIQDSQDAELKTAWKKVYGVVDQATRQMMLDNGGTLKGLFTDQNTLMNQYGNYFVYSKKCINTAGCWHLANEWFWHNGSPVNQNGVNGYVLTDGLFISPAFMDMNCESTLYSGSIQKCAWMLIDVNGFKKPNKLDKDIYYIYILENRILPRGATGDSILAEDCGAYSGACSAKYLYQ